MPFLWHQTQWTFLSNVVNVPEKMFSHSVKVLYRIGFGIQKYMKNDDEPLPILKALAKTTKK